MDERETGRYRGFGFVVFDDEKSMENAILGMNGQQIGGRTISVSRANQCSSRWR
jgi:RNA recognition motif-containing protein